MARRYKLVSEADLKDYRAWLEWYGYSEDDFQLSESVDPPENRGKQKHPTVGCGCTVNLLMSRATIVLVWAYVGPGYRYYTYCITMLVTQC